VPEAPASAHRNKVAKVKKKLIDKEEMKTKELAMRQYIWCNERGQ
jgi:hypothetical protein